ncbi:MAG: phosphatidate cytidylyltransferase [Alphaproteobacteria bacterium]|nr:phosphatidate cytidylyltransferase [Alphaproteobacteria bacterium]
MTLTLPQMPVLWGIAGVFAILVTASIVVFAMTKARPERDHGELKARISSWWVMVTVLAVAIVLSPLVSVAFLGFISFLALKEYFSLIPTRRADRRVLFWAYLAIPIQFYWVGVEWYGMFIIFVPVYMFLFLPLAMLMTGQTEGFLRAAGSLHWGLMTMVFAIGHAAYLLALPEEGNPAAGGAGLLLFLIFLTQFNDVAQYFWGKLFGRHKVIPSVSPNKTVEGLVGGIATTTLLAWLVAPHLTPLVSWEAPVAGLIIGFAGFVGDVTISALKRDLGVKDSGTLIPGHGGILDRIDSLTFTAPLFFHYIYYMHY